MRNSSLAPIKTLNTFASIMIEIMLNLSMKIKIILINAKITTTGKDRIVKMRQSPKIAPKQILSC